SAASLGEAGTGWGTCRRYAIQTPPRTAQTLGWVWNGGIRLPPEDPEDHQHDQEQRDRTGQAHHEEPRVGPTVYVQVHEPEHDERELDDREEEQRRDQDVVREVEVVDRDLERRDDREDQRDPEVLLRARVTGDVTTPRRRRGAGRHLGGALHHGLGRIAHAGVPLIRRGVISAPTRSGSGTRP